MFLKRRPSKRESRDKTERGLEPDLKALRTLLPPGFELVPQVQLGKISIDAVVLCPRGVLAAVYIRDWAGSIVPTVDGSWLQQLPSGQTIELPNPAEEAIPVAEALSDFASQVMPDGPTLMIDHVIVLSNPAAECMNPDGAWPLVTPMDLFGDAILRINDLSTLEPLAPRTLGKILSELKQHSIISKRGRHQPFIFRTSTWFGKGNWAFTPQEAIAYMERHPEDGIFHLKNGTLAQWFTAIGEDHLADLARESILQAASDPREILERFLQSTGMASPPTVAIYPKVLDFGPVIVGEQLSGIVEIQSPKWQRSRRYIFGRMTRESAALHIEPPAINGTPAQVEVRLDTTTLPVSTSPEQTDIRIQSNAGTIDLPVRYWVVPTPSTLTRFILRPLALAVCFGLLGTLLGWSMHFLGYASPFNERGSMLLYGGLLPESIQGWPALLAMYGGIWGIVFGFFQPFAWPLKYSLRQWIWPFFRWSMFLICCAALFIGAWKWLRPAVGLDFTWFDIIAAVPLAIALGMALGSIEAVRRARRVAITRTIWPNTPVRRGISMIATAIGAIALVAVLTGTTTAVQTGQVASTTARAETRLTAELMQWQETLGEWRDKWLLVYYDRRAPSRNLAQAAPRTSLPDNLDVKMKHPEMTGPH